MHMPTHVKRISSDHLIASGWVKCIEMSYIHLKSSAILGELPGYQFPPKKSVMASASDAAGSFQQNGLERMLVGIFGSPKKYADLNMWTCS